MKRTPRRPPTACRSRTGWPPSVCAGCWRSTALAAPLFLLTPRFEGAAWDSASLASPGRRTEPPAGSVGFSQSIDLNRSGAVRLSDDEAFRVAVVAPDGQAPPTLAADQRWRGGVLDTYELGRWWNKDMVDTGGLEGRRPPPASSAVAAGRYGLDFTVHASRRRLLSGRTRAHRRGRGPPHPRRFGGPPQARRVARIHAGHGAAAVARIATNTVTSRRPRIDDAPDRSPADVDVFYREPLTRQDVPGLGRVDGRAADPPCRQPGFRHYAGRRCRPWRSRPAPRLRSPRNHGSG